MTRDTHQSVSPDPSTGCPPDPHYTASAESSSHAHGLAALTILGWLGLAGFVVMVACIGGIEPEVRLFQFAYALGFAGYFLLAVVLGRVKSSSQATHWPWWLLGSLALRVILIATTPSDDVNRYIWEGRVQQAGFNPYAHPPDDPVLAHLRNEDWKNINHPDYPAIYPPVAQAIFLMAATIHPSPMSVKCMVILCDALVVILLASVLRAMGRSPHGAMLYALCPLVLTSFAVEAHIDSLMLLFTMLSIRTAQVHRMNLAAIALGLAISSKLIVIVLLPWLFFRSRRSAILALTVFALSYLPYASAGASLTESLTRFGGGTSFFSLGETSGIVNFDAPMTKIIVAIVFVCWISWISYRTTSYAHAASTSLTALLLLMPIVHYWYLSWVILFVPFVRQWRWVAAACAMVVYFEAQAKLVANGVWLMPPWAPMIVWGCLGLAWLVDIILAQTKSTNTHAVSPH